VRANLSRTGSRCPISTAAVIASEPCSPPSASSPSLAAQPAVSRAPASLPHMGPRSSAAAANHGLIAAAKSLPARDEVSPSRPPQLSALPVLSRKRLRVAPPAASAASGIDATAPAGPSLPNPSSALVLPCVASSTTVAASAFTRWAAAAPAAAAGSGAVGGGRLAGLVRVALPRSSAIRLGAFSRGALVSSNLGELSPGSLLSNGAAAEAPAGSPPKPRSPSAAPPRPSRSAATSAVVRRPAGPSPRRPFLPPPARRRMPVLPREI